MDSFDYKERATPGRRIANLIFNVLTIFTLLGVVCVVGVFLVIFTNPQTAINPFKPPVLPTASSLPTATITPRSILPPTWTPEPTLPPTEAPTRQPSATPLPSETPFSLFTPTTIPTSPSSGSLPFEIGKGTPISTASLAFHPEAGCNWMGVAGQVFDISGAPVSGQLVKIGGTLAGTPVEMLSITGAASAYGNAGFYEFNLGNTPAASVATLWVQLLDQAELPMSDKIYFDTLDSCDDNLVFINFQQVR
jgi:hypothetical protein